MKIGFDNQKYLKLQSERILERVAHFGGKLYLEFGGKLFDDYHASRVLPGFQPDSKMKVLLQLKEQAEIVIAINAAHIEMNKRRGDLGITYDLDVMRLIDTFRSIGLYVGSVVITQYAGQQAAEAFQRKLEALGVKVYRHYPIADYPSNINLIVSNEGYGRNEYIETSRPIVIVTAPGPGSGKMATCLSQLYQEHKRGVNAGYAKYETFPIWNLPLKHPVNLAYEAATADLADVNMIDPFHLEAYGETTVNYNRDIEIFPVLETIFRSIFGECPYKSPTDMGVNMAGFAICDDDACREASYQEIIRRYFASACAVKKGVAMPEELRKQEMLMNSLHLDVSMRRTVPAARAKAAETGAPAAAIELPDGRLVTGKTSGLMGASCAALLNAIKLSAGIDDREPHFSDGSRAHPAPEDRASGQFQPPPAHGRGPHRAVHQRRDESDRRACHGGAGLPARQSGAFVRHSLLGRRGDVQAPRHERYVRAGLSVAHALSQVRDRRYGTFPQ